MTGLQEGPLCVECAGMLLDPASCVLLAGQHYPCGDRAILARAINATEGGAYRVQIDNMTECGIYADTLYNGTALCLTHAVIARWTRA